MLDNALTHMIVLSMSMPLSADMGCIHLL